MNEIEKIIAEINEKYLPVIKKILKANAMHFIDVKIASQEDDMKHATDFTIEIVGGSVAVRVRFDKKIYARNNMVYRDFTIRSKTKYGNKTEIDKLREGFAKWYLYLWHRVDSGFDWVVLDMDKVRNCGILDKQRKEIPNTDKATHFISIPLRELRDNLCIISEHISYGVGQSA